MKARNEQLRPSGKKNPLFGLTFIVSVWAKSSTFVACMIFGLSMAWQFNAAQRLHLPKSPRFRSDDHVKDEIFVRSFFYRKTLPST